MCIVIDTNSLASVFNKDCADHVDFQPVFDWILTGKGIIVYGGSTYITELQNTSTYLRLIIDLEKARKVAHINDDLIDQEEIRISKISKKQKFNDKHLVAIISVSRCRLICSKDMESFPFILDKKFYPKKCKVPKIYSRKANSRLLTKVNIVDLKNII